MDFANTYDGHGFRDASHCAGKPSAKQANAQRTLRATDSLRKVSGKLLRAALYGLVLFVLVGLVHRQTTEFIRDFEQMLVALVPFGADFT